ncbi:MAG TPA: bifunctional diguanylate cyclase/phosphodiesterase [Steroidobacteraceae bacterium]|jgi:diguanylate cyclase (GGDEF)-like protein|nr:bifunctional diguanylate cyclase/phosphodiesterase [Steroidobacteraceae bacterium]
MSLSVSTLRRHSTWLPALFVFATVAAAGSRLVVLSVQRSAEQARNAAQAVAARAAQAIERQIEELATHASSAAGPQASQSSDSPTAPTRSPGRPSQPAIKQFEWAADGSVIATGSADSTTARAIVSEWQAASPAHGAPSAAVLGPLREGSEWLIAARAPLNRPAASAAGSSGGWAVAYANLDRLLARAQLGRALGAGDDFALVQTDAANGYARSFGATNPMPLSNPAASVIRAPPGFAFASPGALTVQVRPRAGWYPTRTLATDIGLLALLAWLLTFTAHDLTHRTIRLRASLAAARRQLHSANQRLAREIEQRESLQVSVNRARFHDAFTGLPNRYYFMDQLDRALRELRARRGRRIGVFLIGIDRFQLINETLGHTAGDELMVQAGRRFQNLVPSASVLARWSGDQFALLVRDLGSSDAAPQLAGALQAALLEPFELRRHRLGITARIGLSCLESRPQRAEQLMQEAEVALSVAKRQEEAACVTYSPSMGGDAATLVSLEADLYVALERRELKLLFQPIVALRGRRAVGAEALLRWRHPIEGVLGPDRFLAIAEETGIIVPITRWTIRTVCVLASQWQRRLPPGTDFYLSVNLSASALRDPQLSDYVAGQLSETAIPPRTLKFELTEGGLISNVVAARETLERLRQTGVELMLDDFGTGYSSLNHLQLFPFDYVKIDRPWVGANPSQHGGTSLASAMVQLASSLGLTPIAEVVETEATADALEEMGCRFGQGNFFCAPVEAEDALQCIGVDGVLPPGQLQDDEEDDSPTLILPAGIITEESTES